MPITPPQSMPAPVELTFCRNGLAVTVRSTMVLEAVRLLAEAMRRTKDVERLNVD